MGHSLLVEPARTHMQAYIHVYSSIREQLCYQNISLTHPTVHRTMALEVGDFVQKVTDPNVRGHVHQMDNDGMMAVEVDGDLICGSQIDWEEVPSDSMEVM